jgi:hypothetical protein
MAVNLKKQLPAEFSSLGVWFLFSPRQDRCFEAPITNHNPLELWTTSARIAEKATGDSRMLPQLNYKRAVVTFLLAYIIVTILAIALSVGIGMALHLPSTAEPMQNQAYLISERLLPLLNLAVWGLFAWVYLRQRTHRERSKTRREAIALGAFWMAAAVAVDYVFFVLIKNPISLSPHDFYLGQFPWIYLIYVAIFFAPLATFALSPTRRMAQI